MCKKDIRHISEESLWEEGAVSKPELCHRVPYAEDEEKGKGKNGSWGILGEAGIPKARESTN